MRKQITLLFVCLIFAIPGWGQSPIPVRLQSTTPGVAQHGNMNIDGTIIAGAVSPGSIVPPTGYLTYDYYVDASRSDTYTPDGTSFRPYLTVKAALDAINVKVAASPRTSFVVHVSPGTYSDALAITGGPQYLRIEGYGVILSGAITYTPANDVYDKIEFVGAVTGRASKGPAMTISGKINLVKTNDSLKYIGFKGCYVTGEIEAATNGTWVLEFQDCYVTGAIDGTLADFAGAQVPSILIETYDYNKFTGAMSGIVSLYNCWDTEFACNMTNTPYFENRINNCRFSSGTISIIPKVPSSSAIIYGDANSLTSFKARTPTVTGATYSNIDACGMLAEANTWSGTYNNFTGRTGFGTIAGGVHTNTLLMAGDSGGPNNDLVLPSAGTTGYGFYLVPGLQMTGNSIADLYGMKVGLQAQSDATPRTATNAYALWVKAPVEDGTSTITNAYGVYIESPSAGATNLALYNQGATTFKQTLTLGDGNDGGLNFYSDQGETDYTLALSPNPAMTANTTLYFPAARPGAESFLKMGTDGVMDFDTATYLTAEAQTLDAVVELGATTDKPITIDGSTDAVQLTIQAAATPSTNLFVVEDSGEVDKVYITSTYKLVAQYFEAPATITSTGSYVRGVGLQASGNSDMAFFTANTTGQVKWAGGTALTYTTGLDGGTTDGVVAATDGSTGAGAFGVPLTSDSVAGIQVGMVVMADDNVDNAFKVCTADSTLAIGLYAGIRESAASTVYSVATDGIAYAAPDEDITSTASGEVAFVDASLAGYIDTDAALQAAGKNIGRVMTTEAAITIASLGATYLVMNADPAWEIGDPVIYWNSDDTSITGLTEGKVYWITTGSATTNMYLAATKGGAAIAVSGGTFAAGCYLMRLPKVLIHWN